MRVETEPDVVSSDARALAHAALAQRVIKAARLAAASSPHGLDDGGQPSDCDYYMRELRVALQRWDARA